MTPHSETCTVALGRGVSLIGDLSLPPDPEAMIVFAHGSGSGRMSPRNRFVAAALNDAGLGTLLIDLLTEREGELDARTAELRFDIRLLSNRLIGCVDWLTRHPTVGALPVGCFGASTGAAAALHAAAERPSHVGAVVSRGGRPDLAYDVLGRVRAPTLLLVGARDSHVLSLNESALAELAGIAELVVIPGATHLFEEPGALEAVARHAAFWFGDFLGGHRHAGSGARHDPEARSDSRR